MGRLPRRGETPSWGGLVELALDQGGFFSLQQAVALGFSRARIQHHVGTGKLERPLRRVYRLHEHPTSELDEYLAHWHWSERQGVVSHESALALHQLSDVLPHRIHLTVPSEWAKRRLTLPPRLVLHYGEVGAAEREWVGAIEVTSVLRTLKDCEAAATSPEVLRQAWREARARGLVRAPRGKKAGR